MLLKCIIVLRFLVFLTSAKPILQDTVVLFDARQHLNERQLFGDQILREDDQDLFLGSISPEDTSASAVGDSDVDTLSLEPKSLDSQDLSTVTDPENNPTSSPAAVNIETSLIDSQDSNMIANSDIIADCGSENNNNNNNNNAKRNLLSLDPQRACPSNGIPWKKIIPGWNKNPEPVQQGKPQIPKPELSPEEKYCDQRPSVTQGIPKLSILVSCGGPIVGLDRARPSHVLNCKRGLHEEIENRMPFDEVLYTEKFCCAEHDDKPLYHTATWCVSVISSGVIELVWKPNFYRATMDLLRTHQIGLSRDLFRRQGL